MLGRLVHLFHRGPVKVLMVDVDRLIAGHCSRTLVLTVNEIHGQEVDVAADSEFGPRVAYVIRRPFDVAAARNVGRKLNPTVT